MDSHELQAYQQLYREKHREKAIKTSKSWRDDCKARGLCTICKKPTRLGRTTCEECCTKQKQYQAEHREEKKEYHKKYYSANRDKIALKAIRDVYGITAEEYFEIFVKQGGKCAICKEDQSNLDRRLCVDHNHQTGKVRGLLCYDCNLGLGRFRDSGKLLQEAVNYMKDFEE